MLKKPTYVKHKYDIASLHCTIVPSLHILSFLILLWPLCVADADIIFSSCGFFLLSFFFFPRLISAVAEWMYYHASTHDVALVPI